MQQQRQYYHLQSSILFFIVPKIDSYFFSPRMELFVFGFHLINCSVHFFWRYLLWSNNLSSNKPLFTLEIKFKVKNLTSQFGLRQDGKWFAFSAFSKTLIRGNVSGDICSQQQAHSGSIDFLTNLRKKWESFFSLEAFLLLFDSL